MGEKAPRHPRILGEHDIGTRERREARSVTSPRLPMGVATM